MTEFDKQIKDLVLGDLKDFNTNAEYESIRELYKRHFGKIKSLLDDTPNVRYVLESISELDNGVLKNCIEQKNIQFLLNKINSGIKDGTIKLGDIV